MTSKEFSAIVDEHYEGLYRFACSLTGNQPDGADLVQQTFLIWAKKHWQLRDKSKTKTWLFTTLRREFLRGHKRRAKMFAETEENNPANEGVVQADQDQHLDATLVLEKMNQLPLEYREPLCLFYLKEFSYQEIAELLEVPIGTIMSRLSRAKKQLRHKLDHA